MTHTVPVLLEEYDDPSAIKTEMDYTDEYGETPVVSNHQELSKTAVIRGMSEDSAEEHNLDVLTEDSSLWEQKYENIDQGERFEV